MCTSENSRASLPCRGSLHLRGSEALVRLVQRVALIASSRSAAAIACADSANPNPSNDRVTCTDGFKSGHAPLLNYSPLWQKMASSSRRMSGMTGSRRGSVRPSKSAKMHFRSCCRAMPSRAFVPLTLLSTIAFKLK
eukprot:GHRR01027170.1.p1 GENE.GHRR01027170.1~~GHRR01027170.1.p1  ORF type:complete len:137 (-),score=3.71 GHRR01027170.1:328-738(-)